MNSSDPDSEDGSRPLTCPQPLPRKYPRFPSNTDDYQSEDEESRPVDCSEINKTPTSVEDKRGGKNGLVSYLKVALCDRPVPDRGPGGLGFFKNLLEYSTTSDGKSLRR